MGDRADTRFKSDRCGIEINDLDTGLDISQEFKSDRCGIEIRWQKKEAHDLADSSNQTVAGLKLFI